MVVGIVQSGAVGWDDFDDSLHDFKFEGSDTRFVRDFEAVPCEVPAEGALGNSTGALSRSGQAVQGHAANERGDGSGALLLLHRRELDSSRSQPPCCAPSEHTPSAGRSYATPDPSKVWCTPWEPPPHASPWPRCTHWEPLPWGVSPLPGEAKHSFGHIHPLGVTHSDGFVFIKYHSQKEQCVRLACLQDLSDCGVPTDDALAGAEVSPPGDQDGSLLHSVPGDRPLCLGLVRFHPLSGLLYPLRARGGWPGRGWGRLWWGFFLGPGCRLWLSGPAEEGRVQ
ncbi:hypothetical protein OIY81_2370 [Cryptosporidium canis]|uniref:Uncharacterized protein n=1 Tax=Cryptosporidium canis TaxID=195482 RepID=A0ABQ8P218_9CRYT|nr:hypothetical protein OJ252_3689 [Cryptosporidium canis]KAJ1609346.1 hypothetical protein OIY81_2370 [Cryptosporidium canis]